MQSSLSPPALETTVRCHIAASARMRAEAETIAQWRRQPVVVGSEKMPPSFLKHAEDQTILALMTVLTALDQEGWQSKSFADWGVVAAPSFFGRIGSAASIQRFQEEGAWGVSPHLIPHQSLHGQSGTISQALKIYGPNFGIGGGPNAGADAFLIAAAMMMDGILPGLWVIISGHESEWIPAPDSLSSRAPVCQAVAMALTPATAPSAGLHLAIGQSRLPAASASLWPEFQLGPFAEELTMPAAVGSGKWRLSETIWVELDREVSI